MSDTRLILAPSPEGMSAEAWADACLQAFKRASEPVTRRRCVTEGHGGAEPETIKRCLVAVWIDEHGDAPAEPAEPCVFVSEWCVPKPEVVS